MQVNNDRALATGLTFRPIEDNRKGHDRRILMRVHVPQGRNDGFDLETEAALLKKWHATKSL